jgi:hypothetical protein
MAEISLNIELRPGADLNYDRLRPHHSFFRATIRAMLLLNAGPREAASGTMLTKIVPHAKVNRSLR